MDEPLAISAASSSVCSSCRSSFFIIASVPAAGAVRFTSDCDGSGKGKGTGARAEGSGGEADGGGNGSSSSGRSGERSVSEAGAEAGRRAMMSDPSICSICGLAWRGYPSLRTGSCSSTAGKRRERESRSALSQIGTRWEDGSGQAARRGGRHDP